MNSGKQEKNTHAKYAEKAFYPENSICIIVKEELLPELDRVMILEPDVEVVDADAKKLPDGSTYIKVTVEISLDDSEE